MMEKNIISKVSIILIIALLLSLVSTVCLAANATMAEQTEEEITAEPVKAKLNTKIYFEGNTYTFHNGRKVRKTYADGEKGCGVVSIIVPNKQYGVYVSGEGWISETQIKETNQYITISFDKMDKGLNSKLTIDGEFLNVESDNNGIISYNNGALETKGNGTTTVKILTVDGKEIEVLATVFDGGVELNIPEKSLSIDGTENIDLADKKINISAEEDATLGLKIDNGTIGAVAEGNADIIAKVEDKEILDADLNGNASASAGKDGVEAGAKAEQNLTFFEKATLKFREHAEAFARREEVGASAGAAGSVNDKEIVSGDVGVNHKKGEIDPEANVEVEVLDKEVLNKEFTVPVVSAFRALLEKIK